MIVRTKCSKCHKSTTFKAHNNPQFWYCEYCSAHIPLDSKEHLPSQNKQAVLDQFPNLTHFIHATGKPAEGGEVVIKTHPISDNMRNKSVRKHLHSIIAFEGDQRLGEFEFD